MNETELGNVTEPHDFSDERLVVLDTSLRCSICKDLINAPVVAPCSHSFCSMCIRESLLVNPACPVCRATVSDGQLKKNTTLSEVIEAYRLARDVILRHETALIMQSKSTSLGKRKRSDSSVPYGDTSKSARVALNSRTPSGGHSRIRQHDSDDAAEVPEGHAMVSCPVCDEIIDAEFINQHLDSSCELGQSKLEKLKRPTKETNAQAKAWAKLLDANGTSKKGSRLEDIPSRRMPKINYDIKSTKQLRELLAEVGLSDKGDVVQLKQRHERFVNLWNSEIDAAKPRSKNVLLREMVEWENARTKAKPTPKVDDPKAWLDANRNQFDQLISNARPNPRSNEENETEDMDDRSIAVSSSSPPPSE